MQFLFLSSSNPFPRPSTRSAPGYVNKYISPDANVLYSRPHTSTQSTPSSTAYLRAIPALKIPRVVGRPRSASNNIFIIPIRCRTRRLPHSSFSYYATRPTVSKLHPLRAIVCIVLITLFASSLLLPPQASGFPAPLGFLLFVFANCCSCLPGGSSNDEDANPLNNRSFFFNRCMTASRVRRGLKNASAED